MGKWTATVTNKGYALQAKLLSTDKLTLTRVVSGSGSCAVTQLINQTAITDIEQELTVDSLSYDSYGNARLKVILSNLGLTTGYDVNQIGIYATDPDEGEILYAIAQVDKAENIPSISEQPNGFYCSWDFSLTYSNAENVNVTIDPSNALSQDTADKRYLQLVKIGEGLEFDEDGNLKAKAQEITVDAELNAESENPVQNKVVYAALQKSGYTHPTHDAHESGLYKIEIDSKGHVVAVTAVTKTDITALGIPSTNTQNTAGSTDISKKIYLIGTQSQANYLQTFSHDTVYVGADGCLYSDSKKVSVEGHTHTDATISSSGFMSVADKTKLDGIPTDPHYRASSVGLQHKKLYLIGAASQGNGMATNSNEGVYIGTDGCLYSDSKKVITDVDDAESLEKLIEAGIDIENSTNPTSTRLVYILAELIAESVCKAPDYVSVSPEGYANSGLVEGSGAIGWGNTVSAANSFAVGYLNVVSAEKSVAIGDSNTVSGLGRGVAIGYENTVDGQDALAVGHENTAHDFQTVVGKIADTSTTEKGACNLFSTNGSVFVVGNGQGTVSGSNVTYTKSNAFRVSAAGKCYGVNAFVSSGADFAEYFEWADGNPDGEDRRGRFVTLDGDKIRYANADDDYILGVVSTIGAFIGNAYSEIWQGRYLTDEFGDYLTETVEVPETTVEREVQKVVNKLTGETTTEVITEVIPAHTETRYILNPDYDPEQEYISREFRKEWSPVGFHGQVVVIDDGTCQVNGYCKPSTDGTATASETGYRVMKRIDNTHVRVLVK